jgi:hypothetical protein
MIENSLEKLYWEFKIKSKVLMEVCNKMKLRITPYETKRTLSRQRRLVDQGKSWTMQSKHLDGLAVDRVFSDKNWQPSWVWKYPSIHFIGAMCWCVPIYKNGKLIESCHLQTDWKTIAKIMLDNSSRYLKETKKNQQLLSLVNDTFRKYGYK